MLINLVVKIISWVCQKVCFFHYFHYYTVSLLTLMSNRYMYQISVVPLCENLTSHKTFKKSYQKLKNLLYNLIDKNYLLFSDVVEKNTQYDIFTCSYFRQICWEHVHQTVVFCCMIWGDLLHYERYIGLYCCSVWVCIRNGTAMNTLHVLLWQKAFYSIVYHSIQRSW